MLNQFRITRQIILDLPSEMLCSTFLICISALLISKLYFILLALWKTSSGDHLKFGEHPRRESKRSDRLFPGGEYIAPHNETAINISSTLLPKASVCVHGNRTYSAGEKVVRDCEEKCVCSESGIMECQPLCISPYIKASRELRDFSCKKKVVAEEPCCTLVLCPGPGESPCILKIFNSFRTEIQNFEIYKFIICPCSSSSKYIK